MNPVSPESSSSLRLLGPGDPGRLGAHRLEDGSLSFAVFSSVATAVDLCLFLAGPEGSPDTPGDGEGKSASPGQRETHRVRLVHRTGPVWHGRVASIPDGTRYGYRVHGPWNPGDGLFCNPHKLLLDPYAIRIDGPSRHHGSLATIGPEGEPDRADSAPRAPKGIVPAAGDAAFDWEGDRPLRRPLSGTAIMELHVKGFTQRHSEVPEELRGTYAGLAHPAVTGYLRDLGITAVQLLPVHHHLDDGFLLEHGLVNYWGYNTLGFFAPEARYAATGDPVREFREMVKELHRAGLEVLLDVVYNHTCESGLDGPTCLFRGFDNTAYYHTSPGDPGTYHDDTGCGNSVQVPHPFAQRLIMDSLRYWVEEMHVDGFRFDLAVEIGRDPKAFERNCALFRALQQDPVLRGVKLIAEPWDLGRGGYQLGNFPWNWCELNGKFRDCVRAFWRGDPGVSGEFASRLTGSETLFAHNGRTPFASVNFISSHDGFTLRDLVSYEKKHNEANGENNRDGETENHSRNHGTEGETDDPEIRELRLRQIRNFLATTVLSQGIPFLAAGDEAFRTQGGNNNAYCQDNETSWLDWSDAPEAEGLRAFVRRLFALRRDHPALGRDRFFTGKRPNGSQWRDVTWLKPDGEPKDHIDWATGKPGAFAMMLHGDARTRAEKETDAHLVFFFNARDKAKKFSFPAGSTARWERLLDTAAPGEEPGTVTAGSEDPLPLPASSLQAWREVAADRD